MTPGAYLATRRMNAGVSIPTIAASISTNPRWAERDRIVLIDGIEADITPAASFTLVALRGFYPFSPEIYDRLVQIHHYRVALDPPRLCRICACSDHDACRVDQHGRRSPGGQGTCSWVEADLCSACKPPKLETNHLANAA